MLHTETITPECLACLKRLMDIPELNHFYLVGGTALSLRYGHRRSDDIDLFSEVEFDNTELEKLIRFYFIEKESTDFSHVPFGIFCYIDDIKVDFMKWSEPWIGSLELVEGIRMAGDNDIFPMKMQAAMTRGAKKDFFDIALLIEKHSLAKGIEWYRKKYPYNDNMIPLKSLTDFERAEEESGPALLLSKSWPDCKQTITSAVKEIIINGE
jgi:Nucleotidyl transferase AbiEii toxin, Type IV TA system